jgi:hypothetical protein
MLKKQDLLKVDKDCIVPHEWLLEYVLRIVLPTCGFYGITVLWVKYCPSEKKGIHIYIRITPPVGAVLALKLLYLLGDDGQRVSLNRARMWAGLDDWSKLFETANPKFRTIYVESSIRQAYVDAKTCATGRA